MSASPEKTDDAETKVRALLGEWAGRAARSPVPDFARKISIVSLRDKTAYAGFARCLFDVRSEPVAKTLAYRESEPPKVADKNALWSLDSGLIKQYLEQETTVVASESAEPRACNRCGSECQAETCERCRGAKTAPCEACSNRGRKSCAACGGRGSIACAQCAGSGKVLLSLTEDGTRREDVCPQCTGNKKLACQDCADASTPDCAACANKRVVACPACEGRGAPLCAACGGSRRVFQGFSVSIAYKLAYYRSILRDPTVPEAVFPEDPASGKLGETVLSCEGEDAAPLAEKKPEGPAGDVFAKVLAQVPAAGLGAKSKLLLQTLSVEKIPIYEVAYVFEGKEYHAWATLYENRVVALDDPFADLAARWGGEAESFLDKGEYAAFEERVAQAAALDPKNKTISALRAKAGALQRRAVLVFGGKVSAGLAVFIPALLVFLYRSPNRFIPLAALAMGVLGAAFASVFRLGSALASRPLMPPSRRSALAAAAAGGGAALVIALFLIIGPIHRIDAGEFAVKASPYDARPFVDWTTDDDDGLTALVKDYGARGVDTAVGQDLLDRRASFVAAARAQALLQEQARARAAQAARLKAEAAKKAAAALAAKRLAAKKLAAEKAKKKKKKKKAAASK